MLKLGLVTGSRTPSARAAPRTSVVLPVPSSPLTSTTSPASSPALSSAPIDSVSAGAEVSSTRTDTDETVEPSAPPVKDDRPVGERGTDRSLLLEGWRQGLYRQAPRSPFRPSLGVFR